MTGKPIEEGIGNWLLSIYKYISTEKGKVLILDR